MNSLGFKQWLINEGKALDVSPDMASFGGFSGTKAFKNEQQALKAAIVVWKGDPSKLRTHVQDEIDGTPPPYGSEKITQERREMAAALLKAVREKSEIAPTLYRGDRKKASENTSPLLGWTSNKKLAQEFADNYNCNPFEKSRTSTSPPSKYIDAAFENGEDEWIVENRPAQ